MSANELNPTETAALVVATDCPSCGAPLRFAEGARAVRCDHCAASLLVTGRRRALSYALRPRTSASDALALVRFALAEAENGPPRLGQPQLYWIPYLRWTGDELRWTEEEQDPEEETRRAQALRDLAGRLNLSSLIDANQRRPRRTQLRMSSAHVDRTLLACTTTLAPPSLGIRPSALEVSPFDVRADGVVVALDPRLLRRLGRALRNGANPEEVGSGERSSTSAYRTWINARRQIVYAPFWMVDVPARGGTRVVVVDAVAGTILRDDGAPSARAELGAQTGGRKRSVGFRALRCPNCGWELPIRPGDAVFVCRTCAHSWLARASGFAPISSEVAAPPDLPTPARRGGAPLPSRLLPVWALHDRSSQRTVYAPAFRCRRLRALTDLAMRLTARSTAVPRGADLEPDTRHDLVGCALDPEDALVLARFVAFGLRRERTGHPAIAIDPVGPPRLMWLPCSHDGYALRELHSGSAVDVRLLDAA